MASASLIVPGFGMVEMPYTPDFGTIEYSLSTPTKVLQDRSKHLGEKIEDLQADADRRFAVEKLSRPCIASMTDEIVHAICAKEKAVIDRIIATQKDPVGEIAGIWWNY